MSLRILVLFLGLYLSSALIAQGATKDKSPIKYRLLMTTVSVEDVNKNEISISLNAFNTGRYPIDFSDFNGIPPEMEIKFEESFYRSSLSQLEEDIISGLINRNLNINNGKILRNLRFNLPCSETLYKQLTKKEKRYTKNYTPKSKSNSPALKYKTAKKKESILAKVGSSKRTQNKASAPVVAASSAKSSKRSSVETEAQKMNTNRNKSNSTRTEIENSTSQKEVEVAVDIKYKKTKVDSSVEKPSLSTKKQNVGVVIEEKKPAVLAKKKDRKQELEDIRKDSYRIEQASQKEDEKAILESLGVTAPKNKKTKKSDASDGVAFDTKAGVEASKNSYAEKSVCPDMVLDNLTVVKKNSKYVTLEYTLTNVGKGPAFLGKIGSSQGLAIRAFLSSSENISRGSLPLGGGFVNYNSKNGDELAPQDSFTGTLKLDIRKMTKFTPYLILNLDPFNALEECTKANNYGQIKVGG